jgi:putative transposase
VFFGDDNYRAYVEMLSAAVRNAESEVWAWRLMPSHVHLIITPSHKDGLRRTVANAHRRYAARINGRNRWTGHLWQGRFGSVVMDEAHLHAAFACQPEPGARPAGQARRGLEMVGRSCPSDRRE